MHTSTLSLAKKTAFAVAQAFLAAALSACAIVPGLQIDVGQPTEQPIAGSPQAEAEQASSTEFRIVKLTPQSLLAERLALAENAASVADELPKISLTEGGGEYLIGPGDVLQIIVWDHPELTSPTGDFGGPASSGRLVSAKGTIYYPYIGEMNVAGLSAPQLRQQLINGLSRVISKPQVDVSVFAYRSKRVQVIGEVASPGLVMLDDTVKGVLEALNERGGLSPTASRRGLKLIRDGKAYSVDMSGFLSASSGRSPQNPMLLPGDVILVPHRDAERVVVLGEVSNQLLMPLDQLNVTLIQVIATAGGLDKLRADDSGLLVFRKGLLPKDPATVFAVDLSEPTGLLLAGELLMQPGDVVYVKTSGFAKYNSIIAQLLPTISAIFQIDRLTATR